MTPNEFKDTYLENSFLDQTIQICVVTRDFKKTLKGFADQMGIGPWWCVDFEAPDLSEARYRGKPADFAMHLGLAWTGQMMWEIVQPKRGPTIYEEFLEAHDEGIHHAALSHAGLSFDECIEDFKRRGCPCIMEGNWNGIRFRYFETEGPTTTTFEIFDWPADKELPEPAYWYPAGPKG